MGRISAPLVLVDPKTGGLHMVYFRERGDTALIGLTSSTDQGHSGAPSPSSRRS